MLFAIPRFVLRFTVFFALVLIVMTFRVLSQTRNESDVFIENKGQWDTRALYLAKCKEYNAWITERGIVFEYYQNEEKNYSKRNGKSRSVLQGSSQFTMPRSRRHVVEMIWENGNKIQTVEHLFVSTAYRNYYYGNNPSLWVENVKMYGELVLKNVWQGIDIRLYFDKGHLRYDFLANASARPEQISLNFRGAKFIKVTENQLHIGTQMGTVVHGGLTSFQEIDGKREVIPSTFVKRAAQKVGVEIMRKDNSKPFIIDPYIYQTFLGGNGKEISCDMKILDSTAIVTGTTESSNFPVTMGASTVTPPSDVFVSRFSKDGRTLLWSTYLGASGAISEYGFKLLVVNNEIYCVGMGGFNFPTTNGVFDRTNNVPAASVIGDGFLIKLTAGGGLSASTFIGGSGVGHPFGLDIERDATGEPVPNGNIIVAGLTPQNSGMTPLGASVGTTSYQGGVTDYFVLKMNNSLTSRIWSTYIGGSSSEGNFSGGLVGNFPHMVSAMAMANGNIAFAGSGTTSSNIPSMGNSYGGGEDIFLAVLSGDGTAVLSSTYYGSSGNEAVEGLDVDASGNIFIAGTTSGGGFNVPPGGYDNSFSGSTTNAYILKFSSSLSVMAGTFLGSQSTKGFDIAIAKATGDVFFCGGTADPTTFNAILKPHAPNLETGVVAKFNNNLTSLFYGSYNTTNDIYNVETTNLGERLWINGFAHPSMLTTLGTYDRDPNGNTDAFVAFICIDSAFADMAGDSKKICIGESIEIGKDPIVGATYQWTPTTNIENVSASKTKVNPVSTTKYTLRVQDGANCPVIDTVTIFVYPKPLVPIDSVLPEQCVNAIVKYRLPRTYILGHEFEWSIKGGNIISGGDNQEVEVVWTEVGQGELTVEVESPAGCESTGKLLVKVNPAVVATVTPDSKFICYGSTVELKSEVTGGTGSPTGFVYKWTPTEGLSSSTIPSPTAKPTKSTIYKLTVTDPKGCFSIDSAIINVNPELKVSLGIDQEICFGSEATLSAKPFGGSPDYRYEWRENNVVLQNEVSSILKIKPTATKEYIVTVLDTYDCIAKDTVRITVTPEIKVDAGKDIVICSSGAQKIEATASGLAPLTYSWQPTTGLDNPTILTPTFTGSTPGTTKYKLTVTDSKNCTAYDEIQITVGGPPVLSIQGEVDFGVLYGCEEKKEVELIVENKGTGPLSVASPEISSNDFQYISSDIPLGNIPAGAKATLKFLYIPQNQGVHNAVLTLNYEPCTQQKTVNFKGEKRGIILTIPDSIDVGEIDMCNKPYGEGKLKISYLGSEDGVFKEVGGVAGASSTDIQIGTTIKIGENEFAVRLTPDISLLDGYVFGFLEVTIDPCGIKKSIKITGRKVSTKLVAVNSPINFGFVKQTQSKTLSGYFKNTGSKDITITPLDISGIDPPFEILSTNPQLPTTLKPNEELEVVVKYTADVLGEQGDQVEINIKTPCPITATLDVEGTCTNDPVPSLTAAPLVFSKPLKISETLTEDVIVTNNGDVSVVVTSASFVSNQDNVFTVVPFSPKTLKPTESMPVSITFAPLTGTPDGDKTGNLQVVGDVANAACIVKGKVISDVNRELRIDSYNFPAVIVNESLSADVGVTTTPMQEEIESVSFIAGDVSDFSVVSYNSALQPNVPQPVRIKFQPTQTGSRQATIRAKTKSGLEATNTITGIGSLSAAVLVLDTIQGYPGDYVDLPVRLKNARQLALAGAKEFNVMLYMNSTVLNIADTSIKTTINGYVRAAKVTLPTTPITSDSVIAYIHCQVLFGNEEVSPIWLKPLDAGGASVKLTTEQGSLKVLGIRDIGGKRLFDPFAVTNPPLITPNPSDEMITVSFRLGETGKHMIQVISLTGEVVVHVLEEEMARGDYSVPFSTKSLAPGTYRILLKTPSLEVSTPFMVIH